MDTIYDISSVGTVRNRKTGRNMKLGNVGGYRQWCCCDDGLQVDTYVHRAVALAFLPNPEGYPTVDHRDRDKSNNCVENLRWATMSMQQRNHGVCGEVPYKGVTKSKSGKKYDAAIKIDGKRVYIGSYATAEEAGAAFAARFTQEGFDV